jgi:hypothetical protein
MWTLLPLFFLCTSISCTVAALHTALQGAGIEDHSRGLGFMATYQAQ